MKHTHTQKQKNKKQTYKQITPNKKKIKKNKTKKKVTAVIFVVSLSCYDEVMYEDDNENAMLDSLVLFEEICNNKWFINTSMILFLNKNDIFSQKISNVPITECFKHFDGNTNDYEQCVDFIKNQFLNQNKAPKQKYIFTHVLLYHCFFFFFFFLLCLYFAFAFRCWVLCFVTVCVCTCDYLP